MFYAKEQKTAGGLPAVQCFVVIYAAFASNTQILQCDTSSQM
jgi:hypothetical protein